MATEKAFDRKKSSLIAVGVVAVLVAAILPFSAMTRVSYAQTNPNPLPGTTFPPPLMRPLSAEPSYVINISEGKNGVPMFSPAKVSIPAGMTVIWFNNGLGGHTVTTIKTKNYSAPENFDSGVIVGRHSSATSSQFSGKYGGSFLHTFTKPGIYNYTDSRFVGAKGVIEVGAAVQTGNHFDMHVGGVNSLPFDPQTNSSFVLRFVPKDVSIPPSLGITYNVTIAASDKSNVLTSQQYSDRDGMLDLELISTQANTTAASGSNSAFTTSGPDFSGQTGYQTTGTFHIKGPILDKNVPYFLTITMISRDDQKPSGGSFTDTFTLMPKP